VKTWIRWYQTQAEVKAEGKMPDTLCESRAEALAAIVARRGPLGKIHAGEYEDEGERVTNPRGRNLATLEPECGEDFGGF
jgi:hypothetical protein